jgi:hypothetical protein
MKARPRVSKSRCNSNVIELWLLTFRDYALTEGKGNPIVVVFLPRALAHKVRCKADLGPQRLRNRRTEGGAQRRLG